MQRHTIFMAQRTEHYKDIDSPQIDAKTTQFLTIFCNTHVYVWMWAPFKNFFYENKKTLEKLKYFEKAKWEESGFLISLFIVYLYHTVLLQ